MIPARWHSVQISVAQLHHARVGVTAKTLANHKANVRAALRWFGKEHDVPQQGVRLSPEWARFRDGFDKPHLGPALQLDSLLLGPRASARRRSTTRSLMSIGATAPKPRDWHPTTRAALYGAGLECLRSAIDGWPLQRLTEPPLKVAEPAWEEFPEGLRHGHRRLFRRSCQAPSHPSTASAFSRAARRRSRPGGPSLSRWRAWRFGSACRSRA